MPRSGSSNKVGSGRNKGKMAPQDRKDLKGGTEDKRNKGRELEMEETGGGGTPLSSPANLFQIFLKYMPILINRWQIDPRRQMRQNIYKSFEASQKQDQLLQHSLNYSVLGASAWNSDNPSSIFSSHWCFALPVFKKTVKQNLYTLLLYFL